MQIQHTTEPMPFRPGGIVSGVVHAANEQRGSEGEGNASQVTTALRTSFLDEVLALAGATAPEPSEPNSEVESDEAENKYWAHGLTNAASRGNGYKAGLLSRLASEGNEGAVQQALQRYGASQPSQAPEPDLQESDTASAAETE